MVDEIDRAEFDRLRQEFFADVVPRVSVYRYFDTSTLSSDARLLRMDIRLRVRTDGKGSYLQLKRSSRQGWLERKQMISSEEIRMLESGNVPVGVVRDALLALGISVEHFVCVGETRTTRFKTNIADGSAQLDETLYPDGANTYQVEYRSRTGSGDDVRKMFGMRTHVRAQPKVLRLFEHL
jgi:uncharacterized protein YjbK